MGRGRRRQTFVLDSASSSTNQKKNTEGFRYLMKKQLGGVIFGCKNNTMKECILKQLFGLPAPHFSYVKNIDPGLPLFLFNYSNRELHGIYEAASCGKMNINPYAWTSDGSGRTLFPAQVQIRPCLQCEPLSESLFKPIILDNYYNETHFMFELDHVQAGKLISKLSSRAFAPIDCMPQNAAKWRSIIQGVPATGNREENSKPQHAECSSGASINGHAEGSTTAVMTATINDMKFGKEIFQKAQMLREEKNDESSSDLAVYPAVIAQKAQMLREEKNEESLSDLAVYPAVIAQKSQMLREEKNDESSSDLAVYPAVIAQKSQMLREEKNDGSSSDLAVYPTVIAQKSQMLREEKNDGSSSDLAVYPAVIAQKAQMLREEKNDESSSDLAVYPAVIAQLVQGIEELKASREEQTHKICSLEQKLAPRGLGLPLSVVKSHQSVIFSSSEERRWSKFSYLVPNPLELGQEIQSQLDLVSLFVSTFTWFSPNSRALSLCANMDCGTSGRIERQTHYPTNSVPWGISRLSKEKMECYDKKADAEEEIKQLKYRYMMPDSSNQSCQLADETVFESVNQVQLNPEPIFLVGGYDGVSWLSTLESYSPSNDVLKSFKRMNSVRSYASVAKLCGKLFVFGGGTGNLWYDTVESYSPADNKWTLHSSLNTKKGTLASATLKDKIFAIGGGNGIDCFSEVEMYDPQVGRWITTRSMSQKRSCLAAAELNGALYAVGGYDGSNYLATAERFDPREHSWTKIRSMSTSRGCHALAALDGKLYALGGYDGSTMVPSTEIYDPRLATWMVGEPMKFSKGYPAAVVLQGSIYVIGGVQSDEKLVDVIEYYKEGQGWQTPNLKGIGKRCFCSAIVLSDN
ncbi:hypothetical protein HAX54_014212 [Datura stramonium]|uniref:DCD domain-containing protein n=1 Tax=Datura stramonium TaxID=4076 RepID=A0ABS8RZE8_DATST|nr:hypothetical protein [Datura stramonium]